MAENETVLPNLRSSPDGATLPDTGRKPVLEPFINVDVEDRLLRELKRRLFPNDVEGILYGTIVGDLYWQDQLWSLMVDTWPRLQTNLAKLKRAASNLEYDVNAFVEDGQDKPGDSATDKASFVKKALFGMRGNPAKQEHDFKETIEDIIDSWISGFQVAEIYWENRDGIVPKCTRWIPSRYYRYPYLLDAPDQLMLNPSGNLGGTQLFEFPPYKFLVSVKTSHANHPVFSAAMRVLTGWWVASRFGLEWFMTYAQLFGIPRRVAYYEPGDDTVYQKLVALMRQAGASPWMVVPRGTTIENQTAAGAMGEMPQERLLNEADRVCDIMLLGQTLTTDVQESGSRALGTIHKSVFDEIREAVARYAAKVISTQLVPGIIAYNYGGDMTELPSVEPVIDVPVDMLAMSQAMKTLFVDMKIPIAKAELYKRIEFPQPETDEELYEPPGQQSSAPPPFGGESGGAPAGNISPGDFINSLRQSESPEPLAAVNRAARKVSFVLDYSQEPEPGEILRFVEAAQGKQKNGNGTLERTIEEQALAHATERYFERHSDRIQGVHWQSVMDDRTTAQCRHLNGKRWTYPDMEPIGHSTPFPGYPPIFYNCRSSVLPVLRTKEELLHAHLQKDENDPSH